jgi:hypothetical protein
MTWRHWYPFARAANAVEERLAAVRASPRVTAPAPFSISVEFADSAVSALVRAARASRRCGVVFHVAAPDGSHVRRVLEVMGSVGAVV